MNEVNVPKPIPSVKGNFVFGNIFQFANDSLGFLKRVQHEYQPIAKISLGPFKTNFLMRADYAKYVLQENNKNFKKGRAYQILSIVLGNGLLTSNGEHWHRQRKLAQPAFYKQRLALLVETMNQESITLVEQWKNDGKHQPQSLEIHKEMMKTTLLIVTKALFGTGVDESKITGISHDIDELNELASKLFIKPIKFPLWVPTSFNRRLNSAKKNLDELMNEIIQTRRNALINNPEAQFDDLMQMLITTSDEQTGEQMDDQQLRDEIITIFLAGHETTAMSMSWALYLLSQNPDSIEKIRTEIANILGDQAITYENIRSLTYTMQVVQEVMRLYPPAWIFSREMISDDSIDGYALPKGEQVIICTYTLHRDPQYWENPNDFNPDNFLPEKIKERPTYAYLPFGGGPRLCIGNNFALMEMQIMLVHLLKNFNFTTQNHPALEPLVTLKPKGGLMMTVSLKDN